MEKLCFNEKKIVKFSALVRISSIKCLVVSLVVMLRTFMLNLKYESLWTTVVVTPFQQSKINCPDYRLKKKKNKKSEQAM